MDAIEWQLVIKVLATALTIFGGLVGLVVFVVKSQLASLAERQAKVEAKFNEGGTVYTLQGRVQRLEQMLIATNPDNTIVLRAMTETRK